MSDQALDPLVFGADSPCFGCSPAHPIGFRLTFTRRGDEVTTTFVADERYQGPPGVMHGGLVTTLADEIAAWTLIGLRDRFGFTAALQAKLSRPVRIGEPIEGRGRIIKSTSRLVTVEVTLHQRGQRAFSGELTFVLLDVEAAEKLLEGPLPEAWRRFARGST